jgi:hypothetical protein
MTSERNVNRAFLGTGWSFPPEFNKSAREVTMVSEDEDIQESLRILMATVPGERVMNPAYGCGLKQLVFENISESTVTEIKDVIQRAVLFFEPRITLNSVDVTVEDMYEGIIEIQLDYTVRATNNRSNMVYPFYFMEGTALEV